MFYREISRSNDYTFTSLLPEENDFSSCEHITSELISLYTQYFGNRPKCFKLINDYSNDDYPMTQRERSVIYVNCPLFYPPQFVYQLTHELCHWMIPKDVATNLRWFEETLAVASSWFFPAKTNCIDMNILLPYIENTKETSASLDISELFKHGSPTITNLENNSDNFTDYAKYRCIAQKLLPKIEENSSFWHAVPKICDIPYGLSFEKSLDYWKGLLPSGSVLNAFSQVIGALQ